MPFLVIGSFVLVVAYAPASVQDLYVDAILPFLISTWVGLGFVFMWDMLSFSMADAPRPVALATVVLSILVLFALAGGVEVTWQEPWFLGAVLAPGVRLAIHFARED